MKHASGEDLAAYALGALEGRERSSVEAHVSHCDRCAAELRERIAPAVAVLAESVEQIEPPETLRQSLMATVHDEAKAESETAAAPERPRSSRARAFLMRPATGLAVVAFAVAGIAGYLVADGQGEDAQTVPVAQGLGDAGGRLVLDEGSATLQVHGMEPLGKGEVYQVWVADPAGVEPSATFVPREDGTATAAVPEATGDTTDVMVTREPRPGRQNPTFPTIVTVRLD